MSLVRLSDVTRRFVTPAEVVTAVDAVTLTIGEGELVGLAGPSGSGKTTLLHLILGFDRPDAGSVVCDLGSEKGWAGIAFVPQELGLLPELTARENVELPARIGRRPGKDSGDIMSTLGLSALVDRSPMQLSLGEQQRVAVARAVMPGPSLLVADEPTAHQDEPNADRIMGLLTEVAAADGAVLVATHDDRVLARVDRVVRITDGRVSDTVP